MALLDNATLVDLDAVLVIIHDLSLWLKTKGIQQWSDAFPRAILEQEMIRKELYVVRKRGEIVASVVLSRNAGELWDDTGDVDNTALYLHRLAVSRRQKGRKLGRKVMANAENICRNLGIKKLRLETDVKNLFLQNYYRDLGFAPKGIKHFQPYNMDFMRFEKEIC